jgi:hypothetical protein
MLCIRPSCSQVSTTRESQNCWRSTILATTTHFELLLKLVSSIANAFASGLDVVDTDADVAEAFAMVFVAIGDLEIGIALRSVVVGQLDDAFAVRPVVVVRDGFGRVCESDAADETISIFYSS